MIYDHMANKCRKHKLEHDEPEGNYLHYHIARSMGRANILKPCQTLTVIIP
jgi:hypothetical protein